ncbi:MAG TPA: hypothetical protein VN441_02685 [Syntrophomonas sp.]|nr:hypothetical protein [Syntrophomonas sp.]
MKKLLSFIVGIFILLSLSTVCYAGSIPEDLLYDDSAQVYFGEVKNVDGDNISVIQRKNIKGDFTQDRELTYKGFTFTNSPEIGATYLCGYFDENNPLYVWDVTSLDTQTLTIKNTDDLSKRMQEYLNDGKFDEKEKERLESSDAKDDVALSANEPATTIIDENKDQTHNDSDTGNSYWIILILCAALLIGIIFFLRTKRKK